MSVGLTNQSGVVPPLDGGPCELVALVQETDPVPGTLDLLVHHAGAQLQSRGVDVVDVPQRVPKLIHVGSVAPSGRDIEGGTDGTVATRRLILLELLEYTGWVIWSLFHNVHLYQRGLNSVVTLTRPT